MIRRPVALSLLLAASAVAADLPTAADVDAAMAKKDWPAVLQLTGRMLALRGKAAADAGVDRVDAWNKRAEAQMQSGQFTPASGSFEKAAAEPNVSPDAADLAASMAMLAKKSDKRGFHVPATREQPSPPTFDVLDPVKRKDALAALFAHEFDAVSAKAERIKAGADGPAIAAVLKAVGQLKPLDRVAHADAKAGVKADASQTDGLEKTVATNFAAAAENWSTTTGTKLDTIKTQADEQVETRYRDRNGNVVTNRRPRGATPAQQGEVRQALGEAQRLAGVYAEVEKALPAAARASIEPVKASVQGVYDKAKALQNDTARGGTVNPNTGG